MFVMCLFMDIYSSNVTPMLYADVLGWIVELGPRTDPCGTPQHRSLDVDLILSIITLCVLPLR